MTGKKGHVLIFFASFAVNVPLRKYQLSITKTALFSNTMVALPTGLGKTLIAAVVMYNYFRWFPEGNVILYTNSFVTSFKSHSLINVHPLM